VEETVAEGDIQGKGVRGQKQPQPCFCAKRGSGGVHSADAFDPDAAPGDGRPYH